MQYLCPCNRSVMRKERVMKHNRDIMYSASYRAMEMKIYPSKLEERMEEYLRNHRISFESQKIFYIYDDDGWILRYFIVDFYLPDCNIIIEVDGKFHDKQKQYDKDRTKMIQAHYPDVRVLRYRWNDLSDDNKMKELLYNVYRGGG